MQVKHARNASQKGGEAAIDVRFGVVAVDNVDPLLPDQSNDRSNGTGTAEHFAHATCFDHADRSISAGDFGDKWPVLQTENKRIESRPVECLQDVEQDD